MIFKNKATATYDIGSEEVFIESNEVIATLASNNSAVVCNYRRIYLIMLLMLVLVFIKL